MRNTLQHTLLTKFSVNWTADRGMVGLDRGGQFLVTTESVCELNLSRGAHYLTENVTQRKWLPQIKCYRKVGGGGWSRRRRPRTARYRAATRGRKVC